MIISLLGVNRWKICKGNATMAVSICLEQEQGAKHSLSNMLHKQYTCTFIVQLTSSILPLWQHENLRFQKQKQ